MTFIARGAHREAIRTHGLTIKSRLAGDFTFKVQATHSSLEISGPIDVVLFCVKTYNTSTAAEMIRPFVGRNTVVLSVQNGIKNEEYIAQVVGDQAIIGGVAQMTTLIESPDVIVQTGGLGRILLGELSEETVHVLDICKEHSNGLGLPPSFIPKFALRSGRNSSSSAPLVGSRPLHIYPSASCVLMRKPAYCCGKSWVRLKQ